MLKSFILLPFLCFSFVAFANGELAVKYGGDEGVDACSAQGQVVHLKKSGFLSVRNAPGLTAAQKDKLLNGQLIWICEERKDWYGVVYTKDPKVECGVSKEIKNKSPYRGPCRSGWVSKKFAEPAAG